MILRKKTKEYTITISTSSRFLDKLPYLKRKIESVENGTLGPVRYHVLMPEIKKFKSLEEISVKELRYYLLGQQFKNIEKSDALYIYNGFDKELREWYIGGNSLLLMGKAFNDKKAILVDVVSQEPHNKPYIEEIELMKPLEIGGRNKYKYLDYWIEKWPSHFNSRTRHPADFVHPFSNADPRSKLLNI